MVQAQPLPNKLRAQLLDTNTMCVDTPVGLMNRLIFLMMGGFCLRSETQLHGLRPFHFSIHVTHPDAVDCPNHEVLIFNESLTKNSKGGRKQAQQGSARPSPKAMAPLDRSQPHLQMSAELIDCYKQYVSKTIGVRKETASNFFLTPKQKLTKVSPRRDSWGEQC
jgi:hypothetical protein